MRWVLCLPVVQRRLARSLAAEVTTTRPNNDSSRLTDCHLTTATSDKTVIGDTEEVTGSSLACTVITHSPTVAAALVEHPAAEVLILGGKLFKHSAVACGAAAMEAAQQVWADVFFTDAPPESVTVQELRARQIQVITPSAPS
jgi:DeoR C terminal sensor domain